VRLRRNEHTQFSEPPDLFRIDQLAMFYPNAKIPNGRVASYGAFHRICVGPRGTVSNRMSRYLASSAGVTANNRVQPLLRVRRRAAAVRAAPAGVRSVLGRVGIRVHQPGGPRRKRAVQKELHRTPRHPLRIKSSQLEQRIAIPCLTI